MPVHPSASRDPGTTMQMESSARTDGQNQNVVLYTPDAVAGEPAGGSDAVA
ncbi:MAG: hypothetical protein ABR552_09855 [Actinomycetota bacterium]